LIFCLCNEECESAVTAKVGRHTHIGSHSTCTKYPHARFTPDRKAQITHDCETSTNGGSRKLYAQPIVIPASDLFRVPGAHVRVYVSMRITLFEAARVLFLLTSSSSSPLKCGFSYEDHPEKVHVFEFDVFEFDLSSSSLMTGLRRE
jgi:hypothetical protein